MLTDSDRQAIARARAIAAAKDNDACDDAVANATYWFEREVRQYPAVDLDLNVLEARADRIVPMAGRESPGYPAHEVSVALAEKLGRELVELSGGHPGFLSKPAEFARELIQVLTRTGYDPGP